MSAVKKTQLDYESLLKDYDQAQAHLARTLVREKAAKKELKSVSKKEVSKYDIEVLRLELNIAKAKRKFRKAALSITRIRIKQWIKANGKQEKTYQLTIEDPITEPIAEVAPTMDATATGEVVGKEKRKYNRREKTEGSESISEAIAPPEESVPEPVVEEVEPAPEVKTRRPRRTSVEVAAEKAAELAKLKEKGDDFTIIEGIGPKVTIIMHEMGIQTFQQLAETSFDDLKALLKSKRNNIADPTTWPQQAQLVLDNNWEELSKIKNELKKK